MRSIARLIACSLVCAACSSTDAPAPSAPDPAFARTCPDLPASRPADLALRIAIHDYERPEALARWVIVASAQPCPADEMPAHLGHAREQCVHIDDARLDALYAELRRVGLDRIRTRSLPEWPHRGGSAIEVRYADVRCRIADVTNDSEPAPEDRDAYRAADEAIRAAIRAAEN